MENQIAENIYDSKELKEIENKFRIYENFWKLQKFITYPFKINENIDIM